MSTENKQPNWTARTIALSAMMVAVVGGPWLFNRAYRAAHPPTVVAAGCSGFEAGALTLFDRSDAAALNGTFAPGDHVHLAIDLNGVGYSWELKGVMAKEPDVTGSGPGYGSRQTVVTTTYPTATSPIPEITESRGRVSGYTRMEMDIDVTAAGDGAIIFRKTGFLPSFTWPKVTGANCSASQQPAI